MLDKLLMKGGVGKGHGQGLRGEERQGPCNKWFPVNSSVPSGEVSEVV